MAFNADAFMQQTVEQSMDTARIPFPEGQHEEPQIDDININSGTIGKGERAGRPWAQLVIRYASTDPNVAAEMKLPEDQQAKVTQRIFLDLDENDNLDVSPGRNIELGKLRKAAGQNSDDEWSIAELKGATVGGITVKHRFNEAGDPYADVVAVFGNDDDDE